MNLFVFTHKSHAQSTYGAAFLKDHEINNYYENCNTRIGEITVCNEMITYPVKGKSLKSICNELDKITAGSVGRTSGLLEITNITLTPKGKQCKVDNISVRSATVIEIPELENDQQLNADNMEIWNKFSQKLLKHELNHQEIFVKNHQILWQQLQSLLDDAGMYNGSCDSATQSIQSLYNQYAEMANLENIRYDQETSNGIKEGVTLSCY